MAIIPASTSAGNGSGRSAGAAAAGPAQRWQQTDNMTADTFRKWPTPPWQPPAVAFRIVWPILYVIYFSTMVMSWYTAPVFYALALGLVMNFLWVPVFFHSPAASLLLLSGMVTIAGVSEQRLAAACAGGELPTYSRVLMWPYLAWLCFAWTLNAWVAAAVRK